MPLISLFNTMLTHPYYLQCADNDHNLTKEEVTMYETKATFIGMKCTLLLTTLWVADQP